MSLPLCGERIAVATFLNFFVDNSSVLGVPSRTDTINTAWAVPHSNQFRVPRRTDRRITTREVKGIDQDVKLNRALWMLAERMAELKAAS